MTVKVAMLDDWFDTLRTLRCFEKLAGHTVTVFTDHVQDTDTLAERLSRLRRAGVDWCRNEGDLFRVVDELNGVP